MNKILAVTGSILVIGAVLGFLDGDYLGSLACVFAASAAIAAL